MKDDKATGEGQNRAAAKNPRRDRLKLALRENLKRRKSQARGRGEVGTAPSGDVGASLHDESKKRPGE
jgi:hypothetical protein